MIDIVANAKLLRQLAKLNLNFADYYTYYNELIDSLQELGPEASPSHYELLEL